MTTPVVLPIAADDLAGLGDEWHVWPGAGYHCEPLVRRLDEDRYVAVVPFIYTWAIIVGRIDSCRYGFSDRWCYHDVGSAITAASLWDGDGEPDGWHRHPHTGRRRPGGDAAHEFIRP